MVREYTAEFKLEAVKLANEQRKVGQTITKTAKDLGIKGGLLGKWIKKHNEKKSAADAFPGRGNMAPYDKERFDLQKELYQFSLLSSQIGNIAELFNCGAGKRSNKFAQSTLK